MRVLSLAQRIKVIQTYYESSRSITKTIHNLGDYFSKHERPSNKAIAKLVKKFECTGSVANEHKAQQSKAAAVLEHKIDSPRSKSHQHALQLGNLYCSMYNILIKNHGDAKELTPSDLLKRLNFANWVLRQQKRDAKFTQKIIFTDEAHFSLAGYENSQQHVIVWCGIWYQGVIGPYFFEHENGNTTTVNSERYRTMIKQFLWPNLEKIDLKDVWFQQDGARWHVGNETLTLLKTKFNDRLISGNCKVEWPPRSGDLTPPDYFLWSYLKKKVQSNKPETIEELKCNIRQEIGKITPEVCANVIRNFDYRIVSCKESCGGYLSGCVTHDWLK